MIALARRTALVFVSALLGLALLTGCSTPERLLVLGLFTLGYSAEASPPATPAPAGVPADVPAGTAVDAAGHTTTSPGADETAAGAANPPALPENVLAAYRRSGCFEGADDFLVVYRDGQLVLTQRTGDKFEAAATEDELARLADQLASPSISRLDDYFPAMGADLCVYEVTAWIDGAPRTVTTMDGAETSSALQKLIDALEVLRQRAAGSGVAVPPAIEVGGAGTRDTWPSAAGRVASQKPPTTSQASATKIAVQVSSSLREP